MPRTNIDATVVPDIEARAAETASRALEQHETGSKTGFRMQINEAGREVAALDLPPSAVSLIRALLKVMASGKAVTVIAEEAEITTEQAAELLHVSRPYVVGLIDKGQLAAHKVGKQRRLMLKDVLAYKRATKEKAYAALEEMAAIDQELGLR